jgi:hypothetical protein
LFRAAFGASDSWRDGHEEEALRMNYGKSQELLEVVEIAISM